jgi:protein-S-isoprenylcysteine O-methyltransferase Ste14
MRRASAIFGSVLFFFIAPGGIAGLVPWWITRWEWQQPFLSAGITRVAGVTLILLGGAGLIESFGRFALQGRGTPAPIAPPRLLVVTGFYRFVRNPMYVCVLTIIFGEAFLLGDPRLILYGAFIWITFTLFVIGYEEPTLRASFGRQYESYCANVPRWLPRATPWQS